MKIRINENQVEEIEGLFSDYPYVFHDVDLSDTKVPWHWHEELEFNYIVRGSIKFFTSDKSYVFHQGEAFFINSNVLSALESKLDEQAAVESHLFHPIFLGGHFKSIFSTKYLEPVIHNKRIDILEIRGKTKQQRQILSKLRMLSQLQQKEDTEFQTRNILSEIWLLLLEEIKNLKNDNVSGRLMSQERVQTMMSFIQQNYHQKISLDDIAASAAVSRRECIRCFKSYIHKAPYEYLLTYRIEMAKRLLRETDLLIIDIALNTGFSNGAYFTKIFKEITGKTPKEYRKMS